MSASPERAEASEKGQESGFDVSPASPEKATKSAGVLRIEALASVMTLTDRIFIFFGVFLIAYVYGLDGTLRYTYQPLATSSYGSHSLLATINVLRSVIAAAAQPTSAKIADVFGRLELVCVSVLFYVLGTIVEAVSTSVEAFAAGAVIYQVGYTMIMLLVEVIIADITSTRARLLFSYFPALPFLINTWVSGDIGDLVIAKSTWQWGIGMWAIIYPVAALPLIISLWVVGRRARKQGVLHSYMADQHVAGGAQPFLVDLFWRLDVIGIILMIAMFALVLVPFTIAGGFHDKWNSGSIIAPLVVGLLCIPAWILWELRAPHPLAPFSLMKDRGVWGCLGIAWLLNFAWYMQGDYLFTVLIVAFDFSLKDATRVTSLYSFVSVITGFLLGFVVFKVRRLKVFIVIGTMLFMVAFGLLIHYRGTPTAAGRSGVIGAEVLLGIAGGMFPYPAQASLQASLPHEHLAVLTGIFLATYNIGSAFGNTVSGAIWTNVLPAALSERLDPLNSSLAVMTYSNPFAVVAEYPLGTPERTAIIDAYQTAQKLLTIGGICLCVPLIGFAFALRNPKLSDKQNLVEHSDDETIR